MYLAFYLLTYLLLYQFTYKSTFPYLQINTLYLPVSLLIKLLPNLLITLKT